MVQYFSMLEITIDDRILLVLLYLNWPSVQAMYLIVPRSKYLLHNRSDTTSNELTQLNGRIPKRPTGSDCKSDGSPFAGSNPAPLTIITASIVYPVKREPSKLRKWVQVPLFAQSLLYLSSSYRLSNK